MWNHSSGCSSELLRASLTDSIKEHEEDRLTKHLAECETCRMELEQLAADNEDWRRVPQALKELPDTGETRHHAIPAGPNDTEGDSFVDFTVEFLEPSALPSSYGRLGDIEIQETIGRGGMGIVLKGFQEELNRSVAVKVLSPHLATSGAARKRFAREAQATAAIVHPNVMPILTVNSAAKLPYLVMPYVACESLQQRLDRDGALPLIDVLRIGLQVTQGLAAAHAQGLIHRDVKPANILLEKGVDRVMLTDFGLARAVDDASLTRSGVIAGTPQYMSPEQASGESVDARSDQFSLGSVLYAMCTGRAPFRAETSYGILRRVTDHDPLPIAELNPEIPSWMAVIVSRLHSKDPDARYRDVAALVETLEQCLAHVLQPSATPLPRELHSRLSLRRNRRLATVIGLVLAGLVLTSGFAMRTAQSVESARPYRIILPAHNLAESAPRLDLKSAEAALKPPEKRTLAVPPLVPSRVNSGNSDASPAVGALTWDDRMQQSLTEVETELEHLHKQVNTFWESPRSTSRSEARR